MKILTVLFFYFTSFITFCQTKVNLNDFAKELVKINVVEQNIVTLFWIPKEYWDVVLENFEQTEEVKEMFKKFDEYVMVIVSDASLGSKLTFKDEYLIKKNLSLKDINSTKYLPLNKVEIDPDVLFLLERFKPVLAQ